MISHDVERNTGGRHVPDICVYNRGQTIMIMGRP